MRHATGFTVPLLTLLLTACGGGSYYSSAPNDYYYDDSSAGGSYAPSAPTPPPMNYGYSAGEEIALASADSERVQSRSRAPSPAPEDLRFRETVAQSDASPNAQAPQAEGTEEPVDRPGGPLLIYTANMVMATFEVEPIQEQAIAMVEELGGYVSNRSSYQIVLRVPAREFRSVLDGLSELGDVLDMNWDAQDVTDQFTDLDIRLRNAMETRDRLEALLEQASKIEDILAIEEELRRLTLEIEQMSGQMRLLENRIAYSTITVTFQVQATPQVPGEEYRLRVPWLNSLGVERLLQL